MKSETETKEINHIKISDTDSLFIGLRPVLEHMKSQGIEINDTNKNDIILKLATQIQDESNANLNSISKNLFNITPDTHYFQLKQEVIATTILATGKRRYGMFITNKEGIPIPPDHKDALDLKGLEIMKSNMNLLFRKFGEQLIKDILFGKPKVDIDQDIINFNLKLKNTDPRELGKPTGVKIINSYIKSKSGDDIFTKTEKGAPFNTKAAVRYNDILKWKKLDKKYESIIEGDKIFVVNLKKNQYNIDTIGLPNSKIPDEIELFVKENIDIEEIFESLLLNKLKELFKDLKWSFPSLNPNVNKFFSWE